MIKLKTLADFRRHRQAGSLPPEFLEHLETIFHELHESLGEDHSIENFSLDEHGYIVVLEKGDDLTDLQEVGLNPEDKGLLGTWPEFVELEKLSCGCYYRILILYNNEYAMLFFVRSGDFGSEIEAWLKKQLDFSLETLSYPEVSETKGG